MAAAPPIPRIELAHTPTPLLKLERLSVELGVDLWVKRDDLTGLLECGNKIRKLEFLVGDALAQSADTLITCGTVQSNGCRVVAAVAARLGLRAMLVLRGETPDESDGNHLLARLLGAEIQHCGEPEWARIDELLMDLAGRTRRAGRVPYVIPESGATALGALGYVVCGQEIAGQIAHGAPQFDTIAIPAVSGGSLAGLVMAKQLTSLRAEIVGIPIAGPVGLVRDHVIDVVDQARRRFGLPVTVPDEVAVLDGYQGTGRTEVEAAELETVVQLARQEGIMLDPVYTGRAFGGLLDVLRRSPGELGRSVCFVHTGGLFGVFPFRRELGRLLAR